VSGSVRPYARSATTHRNRAGKHGEPGVNPALVGAEQLGPHEVAGGAVEEHAARVGAQVGRVHAELGDGRPRGRRRAAHEDGGLGAREDALRGDEGGRLLYPLWLYSLWLHSLELRLLWLQLFWLYLLTMAGAVLTLA